MGGFSVEPGGAALRTAPPGLERQDKGPGPSKTYAIDMAGLFRGRSVGGHAAFWGLRRDFSADFGTVARIAGQGGLS
ncbi:hypothetical protein DVR11_16915 [Paracoccus versutus]|nr:hypothetical protein DVR11_16915 [Paracoccus versutus]